MERLNLNIPEDARRRLREISKLRDKTEGELARELFLSALERAERDEFFDRVAAAQTPELKDRHLRVLSAFDSLDG